MEAALGVAILVGLIAVMYGWQKLTGMVVDKGSTAVGRRLRSGTNDEARDLVERVHFFQSDLDEADIVEALRSQVSTRTSAPMAMSATFVTNVTDSSLSWMHGTSSVTSWTAHAEVGSMRRGDEEPIPGLALAFPEAYERNGVAMDVSAMRALKHDVGVALRSVDPASREVS